MIHRTNGTFQQKMKCMANKRLAPLYVVALKKQYNNNFKRENCESDDDDVKFSKINACYNELKSVSPTRLICTAKLQRRWCERKFSNKEEKRFVYALKESSKFIRFFTIRTAQFWCWIKFRGQRTIDWLHLINVSTMSKAVAVIVRPTKLTALVKYFNFSF